MKKKKGFTLIELMIVLAIIAILAIVLVPKAAQMKDNGRNAGVVTNVNAVRGVLEAKVVDTNYLGNASATQTLLTKTYDTTPLVNPFNVNAKSVHSPDTGAAADRDDPTYRNDSIVVYGGGINYATPSASTNGLVPSIDTLNSLLVSAEKRPNNKGIVYVYVYTDGYAVFGIDSTGTAVDAVTIK